MSPAASTASVERLTDRERSVWVGLLRTHALLTREIDAELEAAHGLPLVSFEVLLSLAETENERMRMCDLAARVILSRSGLTRLVDRLERQGLIGREQCPSDARGSYAVLTAAGAERLRAARRTHMESVRRLFLERLSADEQAILAAAWGRLLPESPPEACAATEQQT